MPDPITSSRANYYGPLSSRNPNMTGPIGSSQYYNSEANKHAQNNFNKFDTHEFGQRGHRSIDEYQSYNLSSNQSKYNPRGTYPQSSTIPPDAVTYTSVDASAGVGYPPQSQGPIMLGGIPSSSSMPVVVVPSVSADATTPLPATHVRVVPSHSSAHHKHRHHRHHKHDRDDRRVDRSNTVVAIPSSGTAGVGGMPMGGPNLVPVLALAAPPVMSPDMGVPGMGGVMSGPPVPGVLRVHVHRGEGFKSTHALTRAAPYVVLSLGPHKRKTRFVKTTNGAAYWDEQLELDVADARVEWLQVRVQDRHRIKADGVVGRRAELPLQRLCYGQLHPADADTTEGSVVLTLVLLPPGQGYGRGGAARKMPQLTKRGRTKKRDGKRGNRRDPSPVSSEEFSYSDNDEDSEDMDREMYHRHNMTNTTYATGGMGR